MKPEIDLRRIFIAASRMNAAEARKTIEMATRALESQKSKEPTEGEKHYAKRAKFIIRMHAACNRILKYAKHETLRNIEKHFREVPGIESAEGDELPSSLAARLAFRKPTFTEELLAALREVALSALTVAGQQLFDEIGRDDPFRLPSALATAFLDVRENLLSNVPDEVHAEIMQSIQDGLESGETRKELMTRVASKFDEISVGRAKTIATTETSAAFNYARDKAMREAGVTHKRWLHSKSPDIEEPRPTHLKADGQTVPIDDPFNVGGVKFMHPGDDSLGAGPEDVINCFCVSIPVEAPVKSGDLPGHPFRGNQYQQGVAEGYIDEDYKWFVQRFGRERAKLKPAMFSETTGKIHVNPKADYWKNPSEVAQKQFSSGFWSSSHPLHALRHEQGHYEHWLSSSDRFHRSVNLQFSTEQRAKISKQVSRYAGEHPREFIAEMHAAKLAGRTFDEEIERWYKMFRG